jgi:hypothetical protein
VRRCSGLCSVLERAHACRDTVSDTSRRSISAERGIERLKTGPLRERRSAVEFDAKRATKQAPDPAPLHNSCMHRVK